jgi:Zn finger protein HypA/HybF involved in hydrogenase expression
MGMRPEKEVLKLRCWVCNLEFIGSLGIRENISDIKCPKCKDNTVEINIGK